MDSDDSRGAMGSRVRYCATSATKRQTAGTVVAYNAWLIAANRALRSASIEVKETIDKQALLGLVGQALGESEWFTIDQERIDRFADVTLDHQYVHVDPERARETPFGTTIAHGFLTLSLLVHLCLDFIPTVENRCLVVNYGFDKVRFIAPVRVDSRIRARGRLERVEERKAGQFLLTVGIEVEIEGEKKPALVAEWLSLHIVEES